MYRQPLKYQNIYLRFWGYNQQDKTFKVNFEGRTSAGTMSPDEAVTQRYNPEELKNDKGQNINELVGLLAERRLRDGVYGLGQILSNLALPKGKVRDIFLHCLHALKDGEGLRLHLRIDPVILVQLPWEYMHLPMQLGENLKTDFLALQRNISIVRQDNVKGIPPPFAPLSTIRIAGVLSSPKEARDGDNLLDQLNVEQDRKAIEDALAGLSLLEKGKISDTVRWATRPTTVDALKSLLMDGAEIFHYAGHALFDERKGDGGILLENTDGNAGVFLSGEDLVPILRDACVRLIVLNACQTGRRNNVNVWSGIAPRLTREHIPAVVANQFNIEDKHARLLTQNVYKYLIYGCTIDEALYEARQDISQQSLAATKIRDWGVPVLYLRDENSAQIFPPRKWRTKEDYYFQAMKYVDEIEKVAEKITDLCDPFIRGKNISLTLKKQLNQHITKLTGKIDQVCALLENFDIEMLYNADTSPLNQYQLTLALDDVEGCLKRLEARVLSNEQPRATSNLIKRAKEDVEALQKAIISVRSSCSYINNL